MRAAENPLQRSHAHGRRHAAHVPAFRSAPGCVSPLPREWICARSAEDCVARGARLGIAVPSRARRDSGAGVRSDPGWRPAVFRGCGCSNCACAPGRAPGSLRSRPAAAHAHAPDSLPPMRARVPALVLYARARPSGACSSAAGTLGAAAAPSLGLRPCTSRAIAADDLAARRSSAGLARTPGCSPAPS